MRQILVMIFMLLAGEGFTQDSPQENIARNRLSVSAGFVQLKDYNLERVIHQGSILDLDYSRLLRGADKLNIAASYGSLNTAFEDFGSSHLASFHLSYDKEFWKLKQGAFAFAAAATVAADYRLAYLPNWDESHLYWMHTWALGASFSTMYSFSPDQKLELISRLPFVAFVSRPQAYRECKFDDLQLAGLLKNFHSKPAFGSWGNYFSLQSCLLYHRTTTAWFYGLNYSRITSDIGNPVLILSHQIGWQWQF